MREGGECARARMLILLLKGEGKADYESTINDLKEPAPWAVASGHVTGNLSEPQSSTAFDLYRAALPSPLTLTVSPLAALLALSSPLLHLPSSHACIMHSQGRVLSRRLLVVPSGSPSLPLHAHCSCYQMDSLFGRIGLYRGGQMAPLDRLTTACIMHAPEITLPSCVRPSVHSWELQLILSGAKTNGAEGGREGSKRRGTRGLARSGQCPVRVSKRNTVSLSLSLSFTHTAVRVTSRGLRS